MANVEYDIEALFAKRAAIFAKRAAFSREKQRNPWSFTRWCTFKYSIKVWHTQKDKRGTRYAALISAAAVRLLHYF